MHIVIWIAMGTVAGFLTQLALVGNWRIGLTGSLVLGAIGAVIASAALRMLGIGAPGINIESLIITFSGAAMLLWAYRRTLIKARARH